MNDTQLSCMFVESCTMHCMNSLDMPYDIFGIDLWHWEYRGAIWIFHCKQCPSVCWLCPAYRFISGRSGLQGIVCWRWSEMQGNILYWLILLYQSGNLWSLLNYIAVLLLLLVGWLHTAYSHCTKPHMYPYAELCSKGMFSSLSDFTRSTFFFAFMMVSLL